jgi:hypothetical protein
VFVGPPATLSPSHRESSGLHALRISKQLRGPPTLTGDARAQSCSRGIVAEIVVAATSHVTDARPHNSCITSQRYSRYPAVLQGTAFPQGNALTRAFFSPLHGGGHKAVALQSEVPERRSGRRHTIRWAGCPSVTHGELAQARTKRHMVRRTEACRDDTRCEGPGLLAQDSPRAGPSCAGPGIRLAAASLMRRHTFSEAGACPRENAATPGMAAHHGANDAFTRSPDAADLSMAAIAS